MRTDSLNLVHERLLYNLFSLGLATLQHCPRVALPHIGHAVIGLSGINNLLVQPPEHLAKR